MKYLIPFVIAQLTLSGCTQNPVSQQANAEAAINETLADMKLERSSTVQRIPDFQIDNWKYVDHYHIIIETRPKERYLIAFQMYCDGISNRFKIGYTSKTGALDRFEKIIVEQPLGRMEECYIQDIVKLKNIDNS